MRTKISQSEARRLRRHNAQLQSELTKARKQYRPYTEGTHLTTVDLSGTTAPIAIETAARLGFGIRVQMNGKTAEFIAIDPRATP